MPALHCPSNQLCDSCYQEALERLRPISEARGVEWADLVASHVVPDRDWPAYTGMFSELAHRKVADLTNDRRLRERIAELCAAAAAIRWDGLRKNR